jgi:hypothetical protein
MDAEGHHVGGWISEIMDYLPATSEADFEAMWATAPVPADTVATGHECCTSLPWLAAPVPGLLPAVPAQVTADDAGLAAIAARYAAVDWDAAWKDQPGAVDTIWKLTEIVTESLHRLERTKSRSGHGTPMLMLQRLKDPLRHSWTAGGLPGISDLAARMDELGIPRETGRPAARAVLRTAGVKASNSQLEAAIRARKELPRAAAGSGGHSAGLTDSPPAPAHRCGQSGSTGPGHRGRGFGDPAPAAAAGPGRVGRGEAGPGPPGTARQDPGPR